MDGGHYVSCLLTSVLSLHQMAPLHLAAESGRIKMIDYLLDQGAGINIQDENGVSLLNYYELDGSAVSIRFLCCLKIRVLIFKLKRYRF